MVKIVDIAFIIIVFGYRVRASMFVPQIPEKCRGQTYCEIVPNYPTEYVQQLVKNSSKEGSWWNVEILSQDVIWTPQIESGQIIQLCPSDKTTIYPRAASGGNGTWYFVINEGGLRQVYRVEICANTGGACNPIAIISDGYTSFCQQKYVYRTTLAIDDKGQLYNADLIIPSSCTCSVRSN